MTSSQPPSREDVATRWQAVARGEVAREVVSKWAEPLIFAKFDPRPDGLVMQALQYLHGFDLTWRSDDHRLVGHGPPGEYVRTLGQVAEEFDAWVDRCAAYDADPEDWSAERRREAEEHVREERKRN
jgi:hypothetical protein